jgi:oligosaccharide repeat unit polymerase
MLGRDIYSVISSADLSEVRSAVYAGEEGESLSMSDLEWWLILPNTLFSQFSPIAILFFYINVSSNRKSNLFNYVLLLSSITPILSAILIAGRSQIIYWLLSYIFCFLLFKNQMNKQQKKVVLRPFIVLAGAMVVFFASVTLARFTTFSLDSSTNTFNSVVAYIGQPFINYNNFFNNYICSQHTFNRIMPVSHYFVLDPGWTLGDYRALIQSQTGMNIGVFYTFLGDLMVDLDKSGMLIFVFIFAMVSTYMSRQENDNTIPVSRMLLIQLLALIPLQGIFYYSFHRVDVGYYVIGTIILSICFKYKFKRS